MIDSEVISFESGARVWRGAATIGASNQGHHECTCGWGVDSPPSSISVVEAFRKLINNQGKKISLLEVPKFIKKLDAIPEIALSKEQPIKFALALAERGLVGQFMGLWPLTKTTDDWI